jgi:two-component system phosphate regulon sensor histidine kinase PhoR
MSRRKTELGEQELATLQAVFSALAAVSDDALLVVDKACNVLFGNALAEDLLGARIYQHPLNNFIRHPEFFRSVQQSIENGRTGEMVYARPDNVKRSFRIRCAPLLGASVLISMVDLTKARNVEKIQTDFVANVSHELRSPLTSIAGFIETLLSGAAEESETRDRFLRIMDDEAGRMQRLINGLLSLSRIEAEEYLPPRARIDLKAILFRVVDTQSLLAAERDMTIAVDTSDFPDASNAAEIFGDQDSIEQVFHNLVENAVKYGRASTAIELKMSLSEVVDTAMGGRFIRVAVCNQGDGIAAEHLPRLTERFYRVDKSRARQLGGTGLGLAIVKHIVNWHQGRLTITSDLGGTTQVTVSFPSAPQ